MPLELTALSLCMWGLFVCLFWSALHSYITGYRLCDFLSLHWGLYIFEPESCPAELGPMWDVINVGPGSGSTLILPILAGAGDVYPRSAAVPQRE